jgi:TATA-box binding protein (TBP) (component of TFIID and TFIIIB)
MCRVSEPVLQNLVVHFRVEGGLPPAEGAAAERRRNFYVVRRPAPSRSTTFTVFPASGSVIATGLRRHRDVSEAVAWFAAEVVGRRRQEDDPFRRWGGRVVNSTHAGSVECSARPAVSACRAAAAGADKSGARVSLRSQFFPGVLVKWDGCAGAVNLFNNGKFIIVGASTDGQVRELHARLCALIRECWTTFARRTSCAWTAGSSSSG